MSSARSDASLNLCRRVNSGVGHLKGAISNEGKDDEAYFDGAFFALALLLPPPDIRSKQSKSQKAETC